MQQAEGHVLLQWCVIIWLFGVLSDIKQHAWLLLYTRGWINKVTNVSLGKCKENKMGDVAG